MLENDIFGNLLSQKPDIIAQAADFGGDLIRQAQSDHRTGPVFRPVFMNVDAPIPQHLPLQPRLELINQTPLPQHGLKAFILRLIQDKHQGDSRRIPSPHFQPVNAVQYGVDVFKQANRGRRKGSGIIAHQQSDLLDIGFNFRCHLPRNVLQCVDAFGNYIHRRSLQVAHMLGKTSGFMRKDFVQPILNPLKFSHQAAVGENLVKRLTAFTSRGRTVKILYTATAQILRGDVQTGSQTGLQSFLLQIPEHLLQPLKISPDRRLSGGLKSHDSRKAAKQPVLINREKYNARTGEALRASSEIKPHA